MDRKCIIKKHKKLIKDIKIISYNIDKMLRSMK